MRTGTTMLVILTTSILISMLVYLFFPNPGKPYPVEVTVTDTIYLDKPYPVPKIIRDTVIPETRVIYKVDSSQLSEYRLKILEDSMRYTILVRGLRDSIKISESFLRQYPYNPKLLGLSLFRDSLLLTTMNTNGISQTDKYSLFLHDYNYTWASGKFGYEKTFYPKEKKAFSHYVGLSYDFLNRAITPCYELRITLSRFELNLQAYQELLLNDNFSLSIGVRYKLNK